MVKMDSVLQQLISSDQALLLQLNGSESLFWDGVMTLVTTTQLSIPLFAMLLYVLFKNSTPKYFWATLLAIGLTILVCDRVASGICKPLFLRYRPTHDPAIMHLVDIVDGYRGGRYGFISSHASNTFGLCVFLSLLFRHKGLTLLLVIWASLSTYSRIYLGVHYVGDILLGALLGCLSGYLFHRLLVWAAPRLGDTLRTRTTSSPCTPTGYPVSDVRLIILTLLFTYAIVPILAVM